MCEPTTIMAIASVAAAAGGTAMSVRASNQQESALKKSEAQENQRQSSIAHNERRLQEQQRADAKESRKGFQENTLDAYTREQSDADAATAQTGLSQALAAAGGRAITPSTGDATATTGSVSVSGADPAAARTGGGTTAYRSAFRDAMARAGSINTEQSTAQGALAALAKARTQGNQRLQQAGHQIQLANSRLNTLGRPQAAFNIMSDASRQLYGRQAQLAGNAGANSALIGSTLSSLGQVGYSYASQGGR